MERTREIGDLFLKISALISIFGLPMSHQCFMQNIIQISLRSHMVVQDFPSDEATSFPPLEESYRRCPFCKTDPYMFFSIRKL